MHCIVGVIFYTFQLFIIPAFHLYYCGSFPGPISKIRVYPFIVVVVVPRSIVISLVPIILQIAFNRCYTCLFLWCLMNTRCNCVDRYDGGITNDRLATSSMAWFKTLLRSRTSWEIPRCLQLNILAFFFFILKFHWFICFNK